MTDATSVEVLSTPGWLSSSRAAARTPIARGSAWILASTIIAAAGGGLFWLAAARSVSATDVGTATALFSSVAFVNYIAGLGLPVMVARFGGEASGESRVVYTWAVAAGVVASLVTTAIYLPFVGDRADVLFGWGTFPGTLFFAVVAGGATIGQLVDMRLTVQRRWRWVTARIALYSILRFPLLVLGFGSSALILFVAAAGVPAASGVVTWWLADRDEGRFRMRPAPSIARAATRYAAVSYVGQLAVQAPLFVLPVLVLLKVPAHENASFFIAWSIATTIFLLPVNVVKVLLAEGSVEGGLARQSCISLLVNGVIGLVAIACAVVGSGVIKVVYGANYGDAADLLPLLVSAVLPWALTLVAWTHARVIDNEWATLTFSGLFAVSVLVPSILLIDRSGTLGAAQAWFFGNLVTGLVAGAWLLPRLRRSEAQTVAVAVEDGSDPRRPAEGSETVQW